MQGILVADGSGARFLLLTVTVSRQKRWSDYLV